MQLKPTSVPKWPITYDNKGQKVGPMQLQLKGISCPHGTVIVKRTTIQDLINSQHLKSIGFNIPRHVLSQGSNIDLSGHHVRILNSQYKIQLLCFHFLNFFILYGYLVCNSRL